MTKISKRILGVLMTVEIRRNNLKPFFKYSGGKRKEIPVVEKFMPKEFNKFYEPFLGAGAIWLHLEHGSNVVNDNYPDVINFFRVLKSDTQKLIKEINKLSKEYGKEIAASTRDLSAEKELQKEQKCLSKIFASANTDIKKANKILSSLRFSEEGASLKKYNQEAVQQVIKVLSTREEKISETKSRIKALKDKVNSDINRIAEKYYYNYRDTKFTTSFEKAVSFYLMRQLSFSGMLRFSSDGKFNIPYGWYKSFKGIDQPIDKVKTILDNTEFLQGDWKDCVKTATADDFVFLDPPYTREFTDYHPAGTFREAQQRELANWFRTTDAKTMIIINRDELTEELYGDYIVNDYDFRYSIQYRDRMTEKDSNANHIVAINNYKI